MSTNSKRYERAISKVLSEHVEQQVPDNTDLWPRVERRLAQGSPISEANGTIDSQPSPILLQPIQPQAARSQGKPRSLKPNRLLAGLAALLLVALFSALAFSVLSRSEKRLDVPILPVAAVETPSLNGEATYLFSVPIDLSGRETLQRRTQMINPNGLFGFDVAADGSFWLGDADGRILHYSPTGQQEAVFTLTPTVPLEDLKLQGSSIWVAYKYVGLSVDRLSPDGKVQEHYTPIVDYPGGDGWIRNMHPELVEGGNGQMLLNVGQLGQYVKVENIDIVKTSKNMITIDGFPGREKTYKRSIDGPPSVIMLGDMPVNIGGYGDIISWTILKEMSDLSFYVALNVEARNVPGTPKGVYYYILHYGVDGYLIERARVPAAGRYGQLPREVAIAPDGEAYVLRLPDDQYTGKINALDVLRLNFYPPSESLPAIPTHTATPILPTPIPTGVGTPVFIPPPAPTDVAEPLPTEDTTPLEIAPDGDGYRVQGLSSDYVFPTWLGPSRFLIPLAHPANPYAGEVIVDLDSGTLTRSENKPTQEEFRTVPSPDGTYALLLWDNRSGEPGRIAASLLQTGTGNRQTLLDTNPDAIQLAGSEALSWQFGEVASSLTARWIDNNTYVLVRTPLGDGQNSVMAWEGWGKILIGDAAKGTLRVLTERGDVVAVLPDGSLFLRRGWIDGAVYLLPPPYTGQGTEILPAGKWRTAWALSPDGSRLAWLDVEPSPGDWSLRLPTSWFSEDPQPTITNIAVWERASGNIERFPVRDVRWTFDTFLTWRKDGSALLYVSHPPEVVYTDLNELTLDGKTTHLVRHDGNFIYGIRAQAIDGSLYYEATSDEQNSSRLMRTLPTGGAEIVCAYIGRYCALDGDRLITVHPDQITIEHLSTGSTGHVSIQGKEQLLEAMSYTADTNLMLSPDGRWLAIRDPNNSTFHFLRVKD